MSSGNCEGVSVRILPSESGSPQAKLADAEVIFEAGSRSTSGTAAHRLRRVGTSRRSAQRDVPSLGFALARVLRSLIPAETLAGPNWRGNGGHRRARLGGGRRRRRARGRSAGGVGPDRLSASRSTASCGFLSSCSDVGIVMKPRRRAAGRIATELPGGPGAAVRSSAGLAFTSPCATIVAPRRHSSSRVGGCNQVQGAAAARAFMAVTATCFL
jgi:hypothetical protein